jgi:hypothetical protein
VIEPRPLIPYQGVPFQISAMWDFLDWVNSIEVGPREPKINDEGPVGPRPTSPPKLKYR